MKNKLAIVLVSLLISACGGGSSPSTPEPPTLPPPPPSASITAEQAARFLTQATFGPKLEEINSLAASGYQVWLQQQFAMPVGLHLPLVLEYPNDNDLNQADRYEVWWRQAITADDQLRQRVAFALSQILVISDKSPLNPAPYGMAGYYDILLNNAFGNYRELMEQVTLSPMMGIYLSMLGNEKPNQALNIRPDENYARELMQLFSIGLVELNLDGSIKTDAMGLPINTYDQDIIKGFAHVYTGWHFADNPSWYQIRPNEFAPMKAFEEFHDTGEKQLLNGVVLAAGNTAREDLEAALDNVFNHDNVAPFISKQLIQKLVTSNPSAGYIERVATIFEDNGSGVRGDLKAVVSAILLDQEARDYVANSSTSYGKLKEPLLRFTQLWRAFDATSATGKYAFSFSDFLLGQAPLSAPSVFNFNSPFFSPPGEILNAGLVAPEFQILTETYITYTLNMFAYSTYVGYQGVADAEDDRILINIDDEIAIAANADELLEHLNLLLLAGQMSNAMKSELKISIEAFPATEPEIRVLNTLFLILASPQFSIQQ